MQSNFLFLLLLGTNGIICRCNQLERDYDPLNLFSEIGSETSDEPIDFETRLKGYFDCLTAQQQLPGQDLSADYSSIDLLRRIGNIYGKLGKLEVFFRHDI